MSVGANRTSEHRYVFPVVREMGIEERAQQTRLVRQSVVSKGDRRTAGSEGRFYANAHIGAC